MLNLLCPEVAAAVEVVGEGIKQQEGRLDSGHVALDDLRCLKCVTPFKEKLGKLLTFVYL